MASAGVGRYDDGTSEIPDGVVDPVERVIVIGAGIAGLTAANALTHAGVPCVVLEARDRIGGRLHTVDVGGTPVDLGGSWIHAAQTNPLRRFADQVGVECRDGDIFEAMVGFDPEEDRRLDGEELGELLELYGGLFEAGDDLTTRLGPDASAAEGIDAYLDGLDLPPATRRRARILLRGATEAESAATTEETSLRWTLDQGAEDLGDVPVGGYRVLVDAMAAGVPVVHGAVVTSVEHDDAGVTVRTADGREERGSHVVVTLPLGVLAAGSVSFSPPLPSERLEAIGRLGFGRFEKVAMTFTERFWADEGLTHIAVLPDDDGTILLLLSVQDRPSLMCLVYESNVDHVQGGEQQAATWVLDRLSAVLGRACPPPVSVVVSDWARDPFSLGTYVHVRPGGSAADLDELGEPVTPRVLFAGEATQSARVGYADGAMLSGIREAKRLLQSETVALGPLASS